MTSQCRKPGHLKGSLTFSCHCKHIQNVLCSRFLSKSKHNGCRYRPSCASGLIWKGHFTQITKRTLFLHFSPALFNHAESFPCNCQCFCPHTNIMGVNSICGAHGCENLYLNKFKCNIYSSKNVKSLHTHTHGRTHAAKGREKLELKVLTTS